MIAHIVIVTAARQRVVQTIPFRASTPYGKQHWYNSRAVVAGVTESVGAGDEEYGETRLLRALDSNRSRSNGELMDRVIGDVQRFSVGEQADDLTLVIARAL